MINVLIEGEGWFIQWTFEPPYHLEHIADDIAKGVQALGVAGFEASQCQGN